MNHSISCDMDDDDYPIPPGSSSAFSRRPAAAGEEIMELLWQNGTVVAQRCSGGEAVAIRSSCEEQQQHSFMQEDETASWLQYALDESTFDRDSYVDLFNSPPPPPKPITTIDPKSPPRLHNFMPFSRIDPVRNSSETTARGSAMVESNETPVVGTEDSSTQVNTERVNAAARGGQTPVAGIESVAVTRQVSMTSSSGGSGASFSTSVEPSPPPPQKVETEAAAAEDDRKRKGREDDDGECQSEETEFEAGEEAKKKARGVKRSRSAEIHNLSERKRRDRINEKMKTLQELIPASNKTDKVSLLDDAIEYFKSLQLQVQMMSNMGCGMVPMMYPGMQQYMHAMSMGMGMSRPMVPYPSLLPGPTMPHPTAAAAHMGRPIFPMPAPFHQPQVPVPDPSRIQASNLTDPHDPRVLNVVDLYQQYLGLQQAQLPLSQDQAVGRSSATKPSTSKENSNPEKQQSG